MNITIGKILYGNLNYKDISCTSCGFRQTITENEKISDFEKYSTDQYQLIKYWRYPFFAYLVDNLIFLFLNQRFLRRSKNILDFGSGKGIFIKFLSFFLKNKSIHGVEIEDNRLNFSRGLCPHADLNKSITQLSSSEFDIIYSSHVFEHIETFKENLQLLLNRLRTKNSIALIEIPNINSFSSKIAGKYWAHFTPQYHVNHFCKESFSKLIENISNSNTKYEIRQVSTFSFYHGYNGIFSMFLFLIGLKTENFYSLLKFKSLGILPFYVLLFPILFPMELLLSLMGYGSVLRIRIQRA